MFAGCEITDYCTYDRAYINSEIGSDEKYSINAPKWRQFIAEDKRAPIVVAYALAGDDNRNGYYNNGWYASNNDKRAPQHKETKALTEFMNAFVSWDMKCPRPSFSCRAANMNC